MPERVKKVWDRVRGAAGKVKGLKLRYKIAGAAAAVLLILLVAFLAVRNNRSNKQYAILYSDLSGQDMAAIVTLLDSLGVKDYQIRNNDTILVRQKQESELRAKILMEGYPSTGYAHGTYLDHVSALSSSADREQLVLFDLQDSLSRDIGAFDGVKSASVYLTKGEDHRFILSEAELEAKAAVMVIMKDGETLSKDQVAAIQRLVSNAMKGVEITDVTVEDGAGNRYMSSDNEVSLDETMKYKLGLEQQLNEQVRSNVMRVLVPYFGQDNVEVTVHSTVDVSRSYMEQVIYHEPDWVVVDENGGHGIIGSKIWDDSIVRAEGDETAGGAVGTTTNTEINEYVTQENQVQGNEREISRSGEIVYNTSRDNIQTERPAGSVTDMSVAIAVNSARINLQNPASFVHLAAAAAGISTEVEAQKVAIVSYPFYRDNVEQGGGTGDGSAVREVATILGLPAWAVYAAVAGMALFLALLLVILLLRAKKKRRLALLLLQQQEEERLAAEEEARRKQEEADKAAAAEIMDIQTEQIMQMRQDVRQFVEDNPSIAAAMLKNWLHNDESGQ